jgi:hypothetical protein
MKRRVYHVIQIGERWHVRRAGARRSTACRDVKSYAVHAAKAYAIRRNMLGQVVVHGRDGKIQHEWTYRSDPRGTRG